MAGKALAVSTLLGLDVSDLREISSPCHLSAALRLTDTEGSLQRFDRAREVPGSTLLARIAGEFFGNNGNLLTSRIFLMFLLRRPLAQMRAEQKRGLLHPLSQKDTIGRDNVCLWLSAAPHPYRLH